jgi:hypothetical protein
MRIYRDTTHNTPCYTRRSADTTPPIPVVPVLSERHQRAQRLSERQCGSRSSWQPSIISWMYQQRIGPLIYGRETTLENRTDGSFRSGVDVSAERQGTVGETVRNRLPRSIPNRSVSPLSPSSSHRRRNSSLSCRRNINVTGIEVAEVGNTILKQFIIAWPVVSILKIGSRFLIHGQPRNIAEQITQESMH